VKRTAALRRSPLRRTPMKRKPGSKSIIPPDVRDEVAGRSEGWCEIDHPLCDGHARHMHHILLRSQGGAHEACNLLHVCGQGHLYIHANPSLSYEQGWLQRSGVAHAND
jgi:hypothetical protein